MKMADARTNSRYSRRGLNSPTQLQQYDCDRFYKCLVESHGVFADLKLESVGNFRVLGS
jgi:hypothetical protein